MNTLFHETFYSLWLGHWCKQRDQKKIKIKYVGSRTIALEENCRRTLNLTLYLIQTLSLTGDNFPRGQLSRYQYVLKKLLFKAIIVFTSIYFESYCKIPARSNKSIL